MMQNVVKNIAEYQNNQLKTYTDDETQSRMSEDIQYSIDSVIDQSSINELKLLLNPSSFIRRHLVILNSVLQDDEMNGTGQLQWQLTYTGSGTGISSFFSQNTITNKSDMNFSGLVQMPADMRHIVGMRYASPFRMLINDNNFVNVPFPGSYWWGERYYTKNLITITVKEFISQSFIGPPYPQQSSNEIGSSVSPITNTQNTRFHFIGYQRGLDENGYLYDMPVFDVDPDQFGQGYYWFKFPYLPPDTLTLSFGAPFIPFQIYGTIATGTMEKTGAEEITIWFNDIVLFNDGNLIYLSGFTTTDPIADQEIINYMNETAHIYLIEERNFPYPNDISIQTGFVIIDNQLAGVTIPTNLQCQVRCLTSVMYTIGLEFYYTTF